MGNYLTTPEVVCPVCKRRAMYEPVSLRPCKHVLCGYCVSKYIFERLREAKACPMCGQVILRWVEERELNRQLKERYPIEYELNARKDMSDPQYATMQMIASAVNIMMTPLFGNVENQEEAASETRARYERILDLILPFIEIILCTIFTYIFGALFNFIRNLW